MVIRIIIQQGRLENRHIQAVIIYLISMDKRNTFHIKAFLPLILMLLP